MTRIVRAALAAALGFALLIPGADAAKRAAPVPEPSPKDNIVATLNNKETLVPGSAVQSAWTQYGPAGVLEARAVVKGRSCPDIALDLKRIPMQTRAVDDAKFLSVCSAAIPSGTKQAALATYRADTDDWMEQELQYDLIPLPLPVADPQRILVLGDTGCRIKGKELQACDDPDKWPFPRISAEAAKLRPDLVIDVGDYQYRENACPAGFEGCQGTPWGDNWPTWDADFFAPAKPLLAAAPWVIVRGNHEDCKRSGQGFLRLLGPQTYDPAAPCADHLPTYDVPLARMTLAVTDNADAPDTAVNQTIVPALQKEIAGLADEKPPVWWLMHRPIWAAISGPLGIPVGGNLTMTAAVDPAGIPKPVELMLAGHIHTFQIINYDDEPHVPPQIVAGFGGDKLEPTPADLHGTIFQGSSGVHVHDGLSVGGFGFLLMTRVDQDWRLDVYDSHGRIERVCWFRNDRLGCPVKRR